MPTLLIRLSGPLQSWGVDSKIDVRTTQGYPSKSAVIGLVSAALGRSRDDPIDDLAALRFGVRTDQEGNLMTDYHTVHGSDDAKCAYITRRYYLEDSLFVAGLEGDSKLLQTIDEALRRPYYPLFLGRRSCPVTGRVSLGIKDSALADALRDVPWQAAEWYKRRMPSKMILEMNLETDNPSGYLVRDSPQSFSQTHRRYGFRRAEIEDIGIENKSGLVREKSTEHDAFRDLEVHRCICRESNSTNTGVVQ